MLNLVDTGDEYESLDEVARDRAEAVNVSGRRVLITGASRGIGESTARAFADAGARVALVARSEEPLAKLAAELGGDAYPVDLANTAAIGGLFDRIETDGPVDVLVNNAGVELAGRFADTDAAAIDALFRINLLAPAELCRQALARMVPRGRGHIVNVSSLAGVAAVPGLTPYSASKAGMSQLTAGLRTETKGKGIGTTLVELGPVATGMLERVHDYGPTARAFGRGARLRVLVDLDPDRVAAAIVDAVRRDRRHVRMPKRAAALMMLGEAPRRLTEVMLTGLDHHRD
jgi:short-subunit dehydrogenase